MGVAHVNCKGSVKLFDMTPEVLRECGNSGGTTKDATSSFRTLLGM